MLASRRTFCENKHSMCHIRGIKRCKLDTSPSFCPSFLPPTIYSSPLSLSASPLLILKGWGGEGFGETPLTSSSYFSCGQSLCQPNVHTSFSSSRSHPCNKICQHKMQAKFQEKTFRFCRSPYRLFRKTLKNNASKFVLW